MGCVIRNRDGAVMYTSQKYDSLTEWARSGELAGAYLSEADLYRADLSEAA